MIYAVIFGTVSFLVLLWSFSSEMLRILAASILFAQWGLSLGSQLFLGVDTPIEIYWAADFTSAMVFFWLFQRFGGWWLYAIGILFVGMIGAHWFYLNGLHAYYHYWAITSMFAGQLSIVAGVLLYDFVERSGKPDLSHHNRHKDISQ